MRSRFQRIRYRYFFCIIILLAFLIPNNFHLSVATILSENYINYSASTNRNTLGSLTFVDINVSQARMLIDTESDLFILDVRSADEFQGGYIEEAVNIPYTDIINRKDELPSNKSHPILVYCQSGGRSRIASTTLVSLNYTRVYNLLGGFSEWIKYHSSIPSTYPSSTSTTTSYSSNSTTNTNSETKTISSTSKSSVITQAPGIFLVFQAISIMVIYFKKRN